MAEPEGADRALAELESEIERMRAHAAVSVSPCDVAKFIAVGDPRVVARLRQRLRNGDRPRGVRCIGVGRVLFAFDCPSGMICLVPRSFLVVVNVRTRRVTDIIDPFDADASQPAAARSTPAAAMTFAAPEAFATAAEGAKTVIARLKCEAGIKAALITTPADGPVDFEGDDTEQEARVTTNASGRLTWAMDLETMMAHADWELTLAEEGDEPKEPDATGRTNAQGVAKPAPRGEKQF